MCRVIGQAGTPTRYGGEEFTVILPHCDVNRAYQFAEDIRSQVEAHFSSKDNGMQRFLTVSIGICGYPDGAPNQSELLKRADFALYRAKNSGKNLAMIYSQSSNSSQNDSLRSKSPAELFAGMPHASTLFALTAAIDMKDHFTFSHSQNVAEYATALALEMGIDGAHAVLVREAALLHDIGKIGIPEALLAKRGLLTSDEFSLMQTHVERAIDILKHLPSTTHMVPIVLAHHEFWNGTGYPRRLKGEEIPLAARCLAVADAFDAMTSERPYKNSMSIDAALNELLEKAGIQFDPRAAYTFVQMVRRGEIKVKPYQPSLPVAQAGSQ
jgi:putative nucleotidyltransferase with HDIG domain